MATSARGLVAAVTLVVGLSLCVAWAAGRIHALGRPLIDPLGVPSGGGIGSVSVDPISGLVPGAVVAMATFLLLSRARSLRSRPGWALGYVAAAGVYLVLTVRRSVVMAAEFMAGLKAQGPDFLTTARSPSAGDVLWVIVDAAFVGLFVPALSLWLRPVATGQQAP